MTLGTNDCSLGGAQGLKADDLGNITSAVDVPLSGTMTTLAPVLIPFQKRCMGSACEVFIPNLLVAGLADIGWSILCCW